ncbi:trimethylamine N-oxide reductase system protein TorE [Vibrio cholerae]|uniref:trimethylamine N-oxide reductase system protein TorE n=1 Tax=Vibrio cholerae TaxID=666 RepID=UPI00226DB45F|nr:trimethylamine N-oxide reductase system protein TorE [Vibrio cholerae]EKF9659912.1 trimethylamine N-oxide reductase system protein TorE [Vibrio cholerae]EKF9791515.1 trimethylamine N-oxide reductase system protein TorE [Vibrio cholerae]MCX9448250.1 trimethylamine N-oxide reductase system protein TorE [Vibrio cholerae]HDI3210086.1 trimethylamine N-oxide reductase system protein TorE [Vibrio cholerae]
MSDVNKVEGGEKRSLEWKSFLFITVVLFPILSVAFVGGYGFIVWMLQMFVFGPPGLHGGF